MADFCKQCSIEHFGEDFGDLRGLSTEEDTAKGWYASAICEGCGGFHFDHTGSCIGVGCVLHPHRVIDETKERNSDGEEDTDGTC